MLIGANVFIPSTSPWYIPYAGKIVRYTCFLLATNSYFAFEATFLHNLVEVRLELLLRILADEICKGVKSYVARVRAG